LISNDFQKIVHESYNSKARFKDIGPGLPENYASIKTLRDLLSINYKHLCVEDQLRNNLILKLRNREFPYKGIIGYDNEVIPSINRAILSGHDILFVGQIGQAKTKLAETIAHSLLSAIPVVRGTITNDVPMLIPEPELVALLNDQEVIRSKPEFTVSSEGERIIRNNRLDTKIDWVEGASRFKYVLATPDISVKDLVGQIDAIKIAKKGVEYYSIESYSPGQLLQARHGILCIDELPVLDPRKQVALLSVLQEGKFTTGSYSVVFRPDLKIIATANPVDYTHSGKIIEPLYDRLRSHITTHYPNSTLDEMLIMVQEARVFESWNVFVPIFILQCISEISQIARSHSEINHDKGVSVRMSIHSLELLISEAERTRSILYANKIIPRISDFHCILQTSKFELSELDDSLENRNRILTSIVTEVTKKISTYYLSGIPIEKFGRLRGEFDVGRGFVVSQDTPGATSGTKGYETQDYETQIDLFPELKQIVEKVSRMVIIEQDRFEKSARSNGIDVTFVSAEKKIGSEFLASIIELVLEGLRFTDPPLVERRNGVYVSSNIKQ
jgi:magnesium chelatase subunit I